MIEWLKTSLPGIIILGAIGSLSAVAVLKVAGAVIRRYGPPALKNTVGRAFVAIRMPRYVIDHLRSSGDQRELVVTCLLLLIQFVFLVGAMFTAFLGVVVVASTRPLAFSDASWRLVALSALFFLSMYAVVSVLRIALTLYDVHMNTAEASAEANAKAEFAKRFQGLS